MGERHTDPSKVSNTRKQYQATKSKYGHLFWHIEEQTGKAHQVSERGVEENREGKQPNNVRDT